MHNIPYEVHERIKKMDSIYKYPNDPNFHLLKPVDDWPSAKSGNFFNLFRVLTIRGKMSLVALSNLHTDGNHPYDSVYQTMYRILNGAKNINISLQERGLVSRKGRLYELSPLGVLYAIHVFHMGKYYDEKHTQFTKTNDYSYQKNIDGIFDIIQRHTGHFPLFFDNLEYIKASKDLDINLFFDVIDYVMEHNQSLYNSNPYSELDFSEQLEKIIPFVFFHYAIIHQRVRTKEAVKVGGSVAPYLLETSDKLLEKMKEDYNSYSVINTDLF